MSPEQPPIPLAVLASPGAMTARRDRMQRTLSRTLRREVTALLADLADALVVARYRPATAALLSPAHLAARWAEATAAALDTLPATTATTDALTSLSLPDRIWDTVTTLRNAAPGSLPGYASDTEADYRRAVRLALSLDTPSTDLVVTAAAAPTVTGSTWAADLEGAERTAATATLGSITEQSLVLMGIAGKRWVAHHDERTRPTHLEADGQVVPVGQRFTVGRDLLAYPADPAGSPEETYQCRCVMVAVDDVD